MFAGLSYIGLRRQTAVTAYLLLAFPLPWSVMWCGRELVPAWEIIWMGEGGGGFRPFLCTYRLNWARRTSRGWLDKLALRTQDSKFEPWRSEAEHATSRSLRLPEILNIYEWVGKKHFVSLKLEGQSGVRTRDLRLSKQAALTTAPGSPPTCMGNIAQLRNSDITHKVECGVGSRVGFTAFFQEFPDVIPDLFSTF